MGNIPPHNKFGIVYPKGPSQGSGCEDCGDHGHPGLRSSQKISSDFMLHNEKDESGVIQPETASGLTKLTTKLSETGSFAKNFFTSKLEKLGQLISIKTTDAAPKHSFIESGYEKFQDRTKCKKNLFKPKTFLFTKEKVCKRELESIFYCFRNLTGVEEKVLKKMNFSLLFPHFSPAFVDRVWKLIKPDDRKVTFDLFSESLSNLLRCTVAQRIQCTLYFFLSFYQYLFEHLKVIFSFCTGGRHNTMRFNELKLFADYIERALDVLGYKNEDKYGTVPQFVRTVFGPEDEEKGIEFGTFASLNWQNSPYLNFFGLFDYLEDATLRANHQKPEKEGFIYKSYEVLGNVKFKKHWCVVRGGFYWFYHSNDERYQVASRVLRLSEGTSISEVSGLQATSNENKKLQFCVVIKVDKYRSVLGFEGEEEAKEWQEVLQQNAQTEDHTHSSFAPERFGNTVKMFVDGKVSRRASNFISSDFHQPKKRKLIGKCTMQ